MKNIFKNIIVNILTWQATMVLRKYKPKIIAITGSVGKTSTKDAVFTVLSQFKSVRKSDKSFNGEIGIPLTILGLQNGWNSIFIWLENIARGFLLIILNKKYPEYLVLEVGAGKRGDIKNVAKWLHADIVIVTVFPDKPVHVEFFKDAAEIIEEKSALVFGMKKDGLLILNHDDEKVYALHAKANRRAVSYGFNEHATYRATYPTYVYTADSGLDIPRGISFKLEYGGNVFPVTLEHMIGMHYVGQGLAALACALELGIDILPAIEAVQDYKTPKGRLGLIDGILGTTLIDDTYNSSPVAMAAAIEVLKNIKAKRKIAVLGDMLELGKLTEVAHKEVGQSVVDVADILVTVGQRAKKISLGAIENGFKEKNIYNFNNTDETNTFLEKFIKKGDVILLKGSQGTRLEKVVFKLMAHPQDSAQLLCRQEKEWRNR